MLQKILLTLLIIGTNFSFATDCSLFVSGKIIDQHDKSPLSYASIYIQELKKGVIADSIGNYTIENLCKGNYTLIIEHIGCLPDTIPIVIDKHTFANFYLAHHAAELQEFILTTFKVSDVSTQTHHVISKESLKRLEGKSIGEILSNVNGITQLKTGTNISKPIIHGMSGSRIVLINNGIKLESQDWGTEHAPEIDPFSASNIKVIKGVGSLVYSSDAIGGMIILETPSLKKYKNIQANVSLVAQTNGKSIATSAKIEQGFKKHIAYMLQGTYKRSGDVSAPQYVLNNTGLQEGNILSSIGFFKNKWDVDFSYSVFHQEIGILKAAHIGNLTDLQNAIASDTPINITPFSYRIQNPKQKIGHHIANAKIKKFFKNEQKLEIIYAFQLNNRKEFDIRRSNRSTIPSLDMHLMSNNIATSYARQNKINKSTSNGTSGISFQAQHNYNNAETGIRPLIPDYYSYSFGVYDLEYFTIKRAIIELAARYDYTRFKALKFDKNNVLQKPIFNFHTYAFVLGFNWIDLKEIFKIQSTISFNARYPNANELFSEGLHHGVAAIEFGNENLHPENAIKWMTTLTTNYKKYLQIETGFYASKVYDYIYVAPLPEPILTIRGAFPAFKYYQTNARLIGLDVQVNSAPLKFLSLQFKSSIVRGKNTKSNEYLIFMPADRLSSSMELHHDFKKIKNVFFNINVHYVFKQRKIPASITDLKPSPKAYYTLNMQTGCQYSINEKNKISFSVSGENITNVAYRDYLNRFRYFTDEMGWNLVFRLKYEFN